MYGGSSKQIVAAILSPACSARRAIQVHERARGGNWGNLLEKTVCGTTFAFGPKNPWGAMMIAFYGQHHDRRGVSYTLAKYERQRSDTKSWRHNRSIRQRSHPFADVRPLRPQGIRRFRHILIPHCHAAKQHAFVGCAQERLDRLRIHRPTFLRTGG